MARTAPKKMTAREIYEALYGKVSRTNDGYYDGCDEHEYDDDDDDCYCE